MFSALLPKGAPFFELLQEQNQILCTVAETLQNVLEENAVPRTKAFSEEDPPDDIHSPHRAISFMEAEADDIAVKITRHLSQTFITPIDREDILRISKTQEVAIDSLHNMANRIFIFEFPRILFPMRQLSRTVNSMVQLTRSMLQGLAQKRDSHNTREFRALRGECEMLLSTGLRELYDLEENRTVENILHILKWSQAYDRMELVVEQIVELSEALEEAVLKNV